MSCSVIKFDERFQEASTQETSEGYKRIRSFRVVVSEPAYNADEVVLSYDDIPKIGDRYSEFSRQIVTSRTCDLFNDSIRTAYKVKVEYSEPTGLVSTDTKEVAPWEEDPVVSYDFSNYQTTLEKDKSDDKLPVVNSAGDPFDSQPMVDNNIMRVSISRASLSYDAQVAFNLVNTINEDIETVGGIDCPNHWAKLLKWAGSTATWKDSDGREHYYYTESIEIEICMDSWDLKILDCGFRDIEKAPLKDKDKKPVTSPALLNGAGYQNQSIKPVYLTFQGYKEASWSALNL